MQEQATESRISKGCMGSGQRSHVVLGLLVSLDLFYCLLVNQHINCERKKPFQQTNLLVCLITNQLDGFNLPVAGRNSLLFLPLALHVFVCYSSSQGRDAD